MIEALQSHKQQYKRGTKSLLFMITRLAKSVFLLEQWGIPPAFAIKVIQKHILELAKSVEQLARAVPVDKSHHHNPKNVMLNGKNYFLIPSYKNERVNESNQYQSLSSNGFSSKKQTTYSHSKEEIPDFRLESNVDLHNVRIENNLVNNFAEVVGETLLHNLNQTNKSTVNHLQTEDFSSEAVDWFFEGTCQSSIEDYKVLQPEETVDPSSEINGLVPREVKENLPLDVCSFSHLSEVISKSELLCDDNSTQVIHGGTNLFSMDTDNESSSSPSAHIQCQKTVSCLTSSSESTLSAIPVDRQSVSSSSEPLAYHKILPKPIAAAENNVLVHQLSLSSLDQMLKKVGKSKLKMNVSFSSRHFQPNFTCPDQNILAQLDTVVDSIHKGKESQKLGTYSEISPDNSYLNQYCSYQIHFPDDLCYLDSCHLEMMDIVKQVYLGQITATKDQCFNPNLVDCLHVPVSLSSSKKTFLTATTASVYQGLIITCKSVDFMSCNLKGDLTTLLINADLTPSYHHIGYKPSLGRTTLVSTFLDRDSTTDSLAWERKIIEFVKLLKVSLILVRGQASDKLITMCSEIGIYILTNVPFKTMSVLANYLHVDILTYLEQSSTTSVCTLSLEPLADVWLDQHTERNKNTGELYFHVSNAPVLQTLLLSSSCAMSSQLVEERLWKCLYSVASAFSDGKMLPGAGETEHWCADMLKSKSAILLNQSGMESVVVESLADVFVDFSDRVKMNSLLTSGASAVATNSFHLECKSSDSISHSCSTDKEVYSFSSKDLSKPGTELANDFVAADHSTCASHKKVCDPFCDYIRKKPIQYDNYLSKLAMWETAVDVVCMLISVGSSVLTGVSSELADF
ncbi:hypothetical protein Btru_067819 [Bulinus truncatus]|nr:hypothetical protein Btru_067819 [Bulinus truncatus]